MHQKQNLSAPLPGKLEYGQNGNVESKLVYLPAKTYKAISIEEAITNISEIRRGDGIEILPSKKLFITPEKIFNNGSSVKDTIFFELPGSYLGRSQIFTLDVIASSGASRPVYFTGKGHKGTLGLDQYLHPEGFAYRFIPSNNYEKDTMNQKLNYDILMVRSQWSILEQKRVLVDDHIRKMIDIMHIRQNYSNLAISLSKSGHITSSFKVLNRLMKIAPIDVVPYDQNCIQIAHAYYLCGAFKNGDEIILGYAKQLIEEKYFFENLNPLVKGWVGTERSNNLYNFNKLVGILKGHNRNEIFTKLETEYKLL
ncbi:MAG: hypothetical protein HC905_30820 [Bacteroidales bacterium]|nr:hypothetical protein [Bacteroidales bacterium]